MLGYLGQGFNDQVGVLDRVGQVGGQDHIPQSGFRLGDTSVNLFRRVGTAVFQQAGAVRAGAALGGGELRHIDVVEPVQLGQGPLNGGVAPQPDGDVKALVGSLIGDLTAQHTAADENHILNAHNAASC